MTTTSTLPNWTTLNDGTRVHYLMAALQLTSRLPVLPPSISEAGSTVFCDAEARGNMSKGMLSYLTAEWAQACHQSVMWMHLFLGFHM